MTKPTLLRLAASISLALFVQACVPLEWTTARCSPEELGQPFAAYGTPLPFMMWSGVSSMEYDWVPWVLGINLLVVAGIGFAGFGFVSFRLGLIHLLWIVLAGAFGLLFLSAFLVMPVAQLGYGERVALYEFRPVGVGLGNYDCEPSPYWFSSTKEAL